MRWFMDRLIWIVSIFTMIAVMTSCGSGESAEEAAVEKAIEKSAAVEGKDVDVDLDGNTMTVKSDDGKSEFSVGDNVSVPEDFPGDVPTYPGAEVRASMGNQEEKLHSLQLLSKDSMDKVTEYFKKEVAGKGWTEETTVNQGGDQPMAMLSYKKDERSLTYMVTKEGDGTAIQITAVAQ